MHKIIERSYLFYFIVVFFLLINIIGSNQRANARNFEEYVTAMTGEISNGLASLALYPPITTIFSIIEVLFLVSLFLFLHLIFKVSSNTTTINILYIFMVFISLVIIGFSINSIIRDIPWGYYTLCISYFLLILSGLFVILHFYKIVKKKKEALSHS